MRSSHACWVHTLFAAVGLWLTAPAASAAFITLDLSSGTLATDVDGLLVSYTQDGYIVEWTGGGNRPQVQTRGGRTVLADPVPNFSNGVIQGAETRIRRLDGTPFQFVSFDMIDPSSVFNISVFDQDYSNQQSFAPTPSFTTATVSGTAYNAVTAVNFSEAAAFGSDPAITSFVVSAPLAPSTATPLPPTALALGAGLVGLVRWTRRRVG